jgi:taurine dioxygenase
MISVGLEAQPLSGALGLEVHGIDLGQPLSAEMVAAIRAAFNENHVLVFRGQDWTPEQQMAFGRNFGPLDTHPFVDGSDAHPEVLDIITEPDDRTNFGGGWHSDVSFLEEPDLGSILYAVDLPPFGGDTLFANQHLAYDALSDVMKDVLAGLFGLHSAGPQYGAGGYSTKSKAMVTKNADLAAEVVAHPIIRTHPENGLKSLYVNQAFTVGIKGMKKDESNALLGFLFRLAVREAYTCRVQWRPGTVVMWDNRSVQHYALHDYAGQRRHVRRITVRGDRPR